MYNEEQLYALELEILENEKILRDIKPQKIVIVQSPDFSGCAFPDRIEISDQFLSEASLKDVEDTLKHELNHYFDLEAGHDELFIKRAKAMKIISDYDIRQMITEVNRTFLEGRVRKIIDEEEEEKIIIRRKPSWKGFKESMEDQPSLGVGFCLKRLREIYRISLKELSAISGISEEVIYELEKEGFKALYLKEPLVKKVFETIIMIGHKNER